MTSLNSSDYSLKLKPTDLISLKSQTVQGAIDTISNRINDMGVAESSVQPYGQAGTDNQILIELPGVDDPGRPSSASALPRTWKSRASTSSTTHPS